MNSNLISKMLAALILKIVRYQDEGKIQTEYAKELISFIVESVDSMQGDIVSLFSLVDDRCSVCLKEKPEESLISWDEADSYAGSDTRAALARRAYQNCFGDVMLGGKVCTECAEHLPDGDSEE